MRILHLTFIFLFLYAVPTYANVAQLSNSLSLQLTVKTDKIEERYTFHHPDRYTYVKNGRTYKGAKAKKIMSTIIEDIGLHPQANIDDMIVPLVEKKYPSMEHFELRWITESNELYTWVWNSK